MVSLESSVVTETVNVSEQARTVKNRRYHQHQSASVHHELNSSLELSAIMEQIISKSPQLPFARQIYSPLTIYLASAIIRSSPSSGSSPSTARVLCSLLATSLRASACRVPR